MADGIILGGEKIKRIYIEETCRTQVTVFDACTALVSVDDDFDGEDEDAVDEKDTELAETSCMIIDEKQIAAARILSDEAFCRVNGSLWLNGCGS